LLGKKDVRISGSNKSRKPLKTRTMKIIHLINDTYQVVNEDEQIIFFQGSEEDCEKYRMKRLFNF
jgi:hypothetical protein